MPEEQPQTRPVQKLPRAELALALAIVKLKPAGISVKAHIHNLRKTVKTVHRSKSHLTEKFWDSAAYWRNAFLKSEAEQTALHNKIFELEQKQTELLLKQNKLPERRKRDLGAFQVQLHSARKRSRRFVPDPLATEWTRFRNTFKGIPFLKHMVYLTRALHTLRPTEEKNKVLAMCAANLCKEAERSILVSVKSQIETNMASEMPQLWTYPQPKFTAVTKAVEMSWLLLQEVLVNCEWSASPADPGKQVVYYMVCLTESIATALAQFCKAFSEAKIPRPRPDTVLMNLLYDNPEYEPTQEYHEAEYLLTYLLCDMVFSLDLNEEPCRAVLEGMLHVMINRVGQLLSFLCFDGMVFPHVSVPDLRPPEGLQKMIVSGMTPEWAEIEGRQLICFLREVKLRAKFFSVGEFTMNDGSRTGLIGNWFKPTKVTGTRSESDVRAELQKKMTNQLLQAIFGEKEANFRNGLARPSTPPPVDEVPFNRACSSFKEWFITEVWYLVGWECIEKMKPDTSS
ncbi:hypothetical protein PDE_07442 [Penicillium oxalicum 114-2]|uniref:Uncharacterized protein n=1 Tax=Penicillium oxalicum (strain 114-2 / CGMCC 5302) TaxID=933388 RepID=S8BC54_PENO1|nr:hypothetical protein PDE_07442 [Penicillium oxalicum 114-2]